MSKEINNNRNNTPEMLGLINIKDIIDKKLIKLQKKNEEAIKDYQRFKEKYKKFLHKQTI